MSSKLLALSRAVQSDYAVPVPAGKELLKFQPVAAEYASLSGNLLLADPPGVGKTIQEIGYMNAAGVERAVIFAPASLLFNWRRELKAWSTLEPHAEIYSPKTFEPRKAPPYLLCSYNHAANIDSMASIMRAGYPHVVLDECQAVKNPASKRTKNLMAKNGIVKKAKTAHALSGTPLVNRPMELWPVIQGLCPEALGGMTKFQYGIEYCGGFKGPWGWDFTGKSNLPDLGRRLRERFMVRRVKEDVLPFLPKRYEPNLVFLDMDPAARSAAARLASFDEEALKRTTASHDFTEISEARKKIGLAKVKPGAAYIEELFACGHGPLLVFAHHREVIEAAKIELKARGLNFLTFMGGLSAEEKDARVHEFQSGKADGLLMSITAGGVGLTLTASCYNVFLEYSWVPGENEQAIDRTHRIGQTKGVMTDYLVYESTMDERMLKYLWRKQKAFNEVFS